MLKDYDLLLKKSHFLFFQYFFQRCCMSKIWSFFNFSIFSIFFQKWPQWDLANIVRNKVMKNELIWSILRSSTRDYLHGWAQCAPPPLCRIGLSYEISIYNQLLSLDCNGKVIEGFCFGYLWTTKYQSTYLRSSFMHEEVF